MIIQELSQTIVTKEVDRKEFVFYTGLFFLAVTGFTRMYKNVTEAINSKIEKDFGGIDYGVINSMSNITQLSYLFLKTSRGGNS
jgi:hypothetical protein